MGKLNVIAAPKEKFSWTKELTNLTISSEPLLVSLADRNTIASIISNKMKDKYPTRVYKTQKVVIDEKEYAKVWRAI